MRQEARSRCPRPPRPPPAVFPRGHPPLRRPPSRDSGRPTPGQAHTRPQPTGRQGRTGRAGGGGGTMSARPAASSTTRATPSNHRSSLCNRCPLPSLPASPPCPPRASRSPQGIQVLPLPPLGAQTPPQFRPGDPRTGREPTAAVGAAQHGARGHSSRRNGHGDPVLGPPGRRGRQEGVGPSLSSGRLERAARRARAGRWPGPRRGQQSEGQVRTEAPAPRERAPPVRGRAPAPCWAATLRLAAWSRRPARGRRPGTGWPVPRRAPRASSGGPPETSPSPACDSPGSPASPRPPAARLS